MSVQVEIDGVAVNLSNGCASFAEIGLPQEAVDRCIQWMKDNPDAMCPSDSHREGLRAGYLLERYFSEEIPKPKTAEDIRQWLHRFGRL